MLLLYLVRCCVASVFCCGSGELAHGKQLCSPLDRALGLEQWVRFRLAYRTQRLARGHGNTVNRAPGEEWQAFVRRCRAETLAYLQSFNPAEIGEGGHLYFNITWVNEKEFDSPMYAERR